MSVLAGLCVCVCVWLPAASALTSGQDLCQRCECLPSPGSPSQAICRGNGSHEVFVPLTSEDTRLTLELVFIYGIRTVVFKESSLVTDQPVTLIIENCTDVEISEWSIARLRTLIIRDAVSVQLAPLPRADLWATLLEDILELSMASASLTALYSVSIGHIESLTLTPSDENFCDEQLDFSFSLFDSKVNPISQDGLYLCGGRISINNNTFESVTEEGFQLMATTSISIVYNTFDELKKQAFNLTSPEIYLVLNHFKHMPAGVLRGVSTVQESVFINNTIEDIDLGGVLLDMGWDMFLEHNFIECDCAFKRTSILNPKQDMLYLTNSSIDKLHNIFLNNFCDLDCTVTLMTFSQALNEGSVCITNSTKLEKQQLCNITAEMSTIVISTDVNLTSNDSSIHSSTVITTVTNRVDHTTNNHTTIYSSATRAEFLVPLGILLGTLLIASSVCYGCWEINTFRYSFKPSRPKAARIT